jgi:hypothetical protein
MDTNIKLQDIIDERLTKIKAILDCLLAAEDSQIEIDRKTIYDTIWTAHDFLRDIIESKDALTELEKGK